MHDRPIGQRLRAGGLIFEADLTAAVHQQRRLRRKKLGAYLLELGGVPASVLTRAVREKRGLCIGEWLVTQGYVSPAVLACALTRQRAERAMRIGDILVDQGAIPRERLEGFLREESSQACTETHREERDAQLDQSVLDPHSSIFLPM